MLGSLLEPNYLNGPRTPSEGAKEGTAQYPAVTAGLVAWGGQPRGASAPSLG